MKSQTFITKYNSSLHYFPLCSGTTTKEIHIDSTIQDLLTTAYFLLGKLEGISEHIHNAGFIENVYLLKEAIYSCRLEDSETTLLDFLKFKSKTGEQPNEEITQISNYVKAINLSLKTIESNPISISLLKKINEEFFNTPNHNTSSSCPNNLTKPKLESKTFENIETILQEDVRIPTLIRAGIIYFELIKTAPFDSNNGKVIRLLIPLFFSKHGILKKPILYLSKYFKTYEDEYYNLFRQNDTINNPESWLKFFLSGLITTATNVIQTTNKIKTIIESNDKKVKDLGRSSEKGILLLEHLYEKPFVTIKDVEEITSLKNPNALSLVSKFVKAGILEETTGQKRNRVFVYGDYVRLLEQ